MIMRPLKLNDYDAWRPLWAAYLEFYETSVEDVIYRLTLNQLTSPEQPKQCAFVAEIGGDLVGIFHYIIHPHNWKAEEVLYLQDLFVQSDQRDKGVCRALIEAVYKAAGDQGSPTVYWLTQEFNQVVRRHYDSIATVTPFLKYTR